MALLPKSSIASFQVSFSLWRHFLAYLVKGIPSRCKPFIVDGEEFLGRALFSGNYDPKKDKIEVRAFLIKDPSKGISVNRLTYAPRYQIDFLSKIEAQRRTNNAKRKNSNAGECKFYGYASIKAEAVSLIKLDGKKSLGMKVTPKYKNPFHADITLPADETKDYYLEIADALQQKAHFIAS